MLILITLFTISFIALGLMLTLKAVEAESGKEFLVMKTLRARDASFEATYRNWRGAFIRGMLTFGRRLSNTGRELFKHALTYIGHAATRHGTRLIGTARRRGNLKREGSASLYLRHIVEHKKNGIDKEGRIEN